MTPWGCEIDRCGASFDAVEDLLRHQVTDHPAIECAVCGERTPDGFYALRHVFTEHTRAKYVRHYDGDSDAIRYRETLIEDVEDRVDADEVRERAESDDSTHGDTSAVSAGD
jgi:hypothetical protein